MDEATQVITQGAKFTLQWTGDKEASAPVSLEVLLDQHKGDGELCEWAQRARVGGSIVTSGATGPVCLGRRVE